MARIMRRFIAVMIAGVLVFPVLDGRSVVFAQEEAVVALDNQVVSAESATQVDPSAAPADDQASTEEVTAESLKERNETLTKLYGDLKKDRDNLLAQSQRLLEENRTYADLKKSYDQFNDEKRLLIENREASEQKIKSLQEGLDSLKLHMSQLTQERNEFKKLLEEEQQNRADNLQTIQAQLEAEYKGLIDKVNPLKKENKMLADQLAKARGDTEESQAKSAQSQQTADVLKQQIVQLKTQNDDLLADNMRLQELSRSFPAKFAEMVAQNQKLTEETAHMHYNLGVFYVNNREYIRAVEEFNKALELEPHDADSNYNLGFIYAEHLIDRPKAIEYFKKYLTYAPDAKDADWVNKYLLTWETWYGKGTLK